MRDSILIVTSVEEPNVSDVMEHLRGEKVIRLNTDALVNYAISLHEEKGKIAVDFCVNGQTVSASQIKSIWYRRPPTAVVPVIGFGKEEKKFAESEAQRFLHALWNSFPREGLTWVNHPLNTRGIEHNKPAQLQLASQKGLSTPETLVTNDLTAAREFLRRNDGRVAMKAFSSFSQNGEGWPTGIYTTVIEEKHLEEFGEDLGHVPVIFQSYVPKKVELRVTIAGRQINACAIHSQDSERTKDDWRYYDFKNVRHEPYKLPPHVEEKLFECMRQWGLQFGAIDMVVTPDEDHVFLEVNASGHWGWIESLTGLPISKSIAELLAEPKEFSL